MNIEHAINITSLVKNTLKVAATGAPLSLLEAVLTKSGLEEGSFGIFRVTYADDISEVYFDYPTDMTNEQAQEFVELALNKYESKS